MAVLDELLIGLGFKYDEKGLKKFRSDIESTNKSIAQFAKMATAGAVAITGLTIASTKASDEQGKFANEIGESVENIDALGFALARSGGSAEGMQSSLRNLAKVASEAARGTGAGVEAFGLLGISATDASGGVKDVSNLILEVSDAIQGLSNSQQLEITSKLGLDDSIRLLQHGSSEISNLVTEAKALGVTTEEDAIIAAQFQDNLTNLWRIVTQGSRLLSRVFAPAIGAIAKSMQDWWLSNRTLIEQNLPMYIERATKAVKLLGLAFGFLIATKIVTSVISLIGAFKALNIALLLTNAKLLLIPAIITGAILAIGLLAQDAKVFFEGGNSFIGRMIEKFPQWETQLTVVAGIMKLIHDTTMNTLKGWGEIFSLFNGSKLKDLGKGALATIGLYNPERELEYTQSAKEGLATQNLLDENRIQQQLDNLPSLGGVQNNTNNRSLTVDNISINVNGSGNPIDVANEVGKTFQQTAQDLQNNVEP